MKVSIKNWKNRIMSAEFFLLGILSFSLISRYIFLYALEMPMMLPEIFWLLFLLLNIRIYVKDFSIIKNKKFLISCAFLLVLFLFSVFRGGSAYSTLSYVQSLFEFMFFAVIFMDYEKIDVDKMWWLTFGAICGDLIYMMFLSVENYANVNHIAWVVCCVSSFLVKGKYKIVLSYIIAFVAAIFSGYRINIILILVSLLVCVLWMILKKRENSIRALLVRLGLFVMLVCGTVFLYINLIPIIQKVASVFNFDANKIFRVVNRLEMFFSGTSGSGTDSHRVELMSMVFKEFPNTIFPSGLVRGPVDGNGWYYIDIPLILFYEIFGSVLTWIILIFLIFWSVKLIKDSLRLPDFDKAYILTALALPGLYILLLTNGFFIIANSSAVITGILVGTVLKYARAKSRIKVINREASGRNINYERGLENEKNCSCADEA